MIDHLNSLILIFLILLSTFKQVSLTEDTVQNLLSAANLFQLIPLRDGCAEFMMSHVTVSNCIGVFFFAKAHQCNVLALKAKEIINNKVGIMQNDKFYLQILVLKTKLHMY